MMSRRSLRSLVAVSLCVGSCAALGGTTEYGGVAGTTPSKRTAPPVFPTPAELGKSHVTFTPSSVPRGAMSAASARNGLLIVNGGGWVRLPSATFIERFGYLNSLGADQTHAYFSHMPAWEITFGGLQLEPILPYDPHRSSHVAIQTWHDDTVFVDAKSGSWVMEIWNDCAPCS